MSKHLRLLEEAIKEAVGALAEYEAAAVPPLRIGVMGSREGLTKAQWHTIRQILYGAKLGLKAWVGCTDLPGAEAEVLQIATALGYQTYGFKPADRDLADTGCTDWKRYDTLEKARAGLCDWADHWLIADSSRPGDYPHLSGKPATLIRQDGQYEHVPGVAK